MDTSSKPETYETKGIRTNGRRTFLVRFAGQQVYDLLQMLERQAVGATDYRHVRQAVAFGEEIREQVRAQGF